MLFPLVHACYKDMQHRSKHNSIIWAWRNRAKFKFLSDIHWLNTIQYFIAKLVVFWHISTKLNGLSCLAGLLSGPCSFLLPDVQTWICTVHTQDLKPTVLPQYIDEMRSRSSMAKKTHSHIPPLSKKRCHCWRFAYNLRWQALPEKAVDSSLYNWTDSWRTIEHSNIITSTEPMKQLLS